MNKKWQMMRIPYMDETVNIYGIKYIIHGNLMNHNQGYVLNDVESLNYLLLPTASSTTN